MDLTFAPPPIRGEASKGPPDRGFVTGAFGRTKGGQGMLSWGKSNVIGRILALYCVL